VGHGLVRRLDHRGHLDFRGHRDRRGRILDRILVQTLLAGQMSVIVEPLSTVGPGDAHEFGGEMRWARKIKLAAVKVERRASRAEWW